MICKHPVTLGCGLCYSYNIFYGTSVFNSIFFSYAQTQCQPHLTETVKKSVEGICLKVCHLSSEYAKKVREKQSEIYKEQGITGE